MNYLMRCNIHTILPGICEDPESSSGFKFHTPFLPPPTRIQSNATAARRKEHIVTWCWDDCIDPDSPEADELEKQGRGRASATGEFVRSLQVGDIITVWARARFPLWMNYVEEMRIDVYWAV
jgi:hypothetical protein